MRTLTFAGHEWVVKSSDGARVGPGANLFSDAGNVVWVDGDGALHLTIRRHRDAWRCAEVIAVPALGFGRYRFRVERELAFDRNVVAAMFLYLDDRHEIDIEVGRFGSEHDFTNAQFAVQPMDRHPGGFRHRITLPSNSRPTIHEIEWHRDVVHFRCLTSAGHVVAAASTRHAVPHGALKARVNLWLYAGSEASGLPPSDGCEAELVIGSFDFSRSS